jgi:periplasmic protein TonB
MPQPIENPRPVYPPAAIANGWQGRVLLRLSVSAAGLVEKVEIAAGSGVSILDKAAVVAVQQWRFRPATQGGIPIHTSILLPVVFELSS